VKQRADESCVSIGEFLSEYEGKLKELLDNPHEDPSFQKIAVQDETANIDRLQLRVEEAQSKSVEASLRLTKLLSSDTLDPNDAGISNGEHTRSSRFWHRPVLCKPYYSLHLSGTIRNTDKRGSQS
jgi:hypothetical protein